MPALLENADPQCFTFWNDRLVHYGWGGESAMAVKMAKEARLVFARIQSSVIWRQLLASATDLWVNATTPRYLDPDSDEAALREFFNSQNVDLDELLDAAATHFESAGIHRRTDPLSAEELEKLIEDDEHSISR